MTLTKGATLTIVNNDVMPHKLVKVSSAALSLPRRSNETKGALMKRSLSVLVVAGASLLLAATASSQSGTTLTIRHQMHGCHAWSVNGGAYKPSQSLTLKKGATLNDR